MTAAAALPAPTRANWRLPMGSSQASGNPGKAACRWTATTRGETEKGKLDEEADANEDNARRKPGPAATRT
eukprot:1149374-Pyramimonas_sp.AAC.1